MNEINIFITGDFCPIRGAEDKLLDGFNSQEIFAGLDENIEEADISVTNLECPLTFVDNPIDKLGGNFKSNPKIGKILKKSKFDLITLANNHIYDHGDKGLKDTIEALEKYGLDYVGASHTLKDAQKPYFVNLKGLKLAFLNFAEVEFSCANENHGGANPMEVIDNIHQIRSAKEEADKVIVIIHGGHEHHHYPSPETKKRYRFFAEEGADAIVAHHTHCVGGYEIYEGVPIFYSLGNFLFPGTKNPRDSWFEGYAVNLKIDENDINFEILPYEQCKHNDISIELKSKESQLYNKIERISDELDDDELIKTKFEQYIQGRREKVFLGRMAGYRRSIIFGFRKLRIFKLLKYLMRKKDMMFIKQMITCQAHRETAIKILKDYLRY